MPDEIQYSRRKDDHASRRLRRGMYVLPSLFTAANVLLGYYAILQVIHGAIQYAIGIPDAWHFDNAAKAIGFAVLFDGLDGRIARMTRTTSDFGRELDSLADVITFGIAPAVLAWAWGFRLLPFIGYGDVPPWISLESSDLRVKLVQLGIIASFVFLTA